MLVEAPEVLKTEVALLPDAGILGADDGEPAKFLMIDGGGHLCLFHAEISSGTETPAAVVPLGLEGFDRLEAVHRLLASLHQRAIPPDTRLAPQQRLRIRRMLQAHDARQSGATQKEIARGIFRTGDLSRDEWQVHSTRYAVIGLLKDAKALVAGGYRRLLRHRRRR